MCFQGRLACVAAPPRVSSTMPLKERQPAPTARRVFYETRNMLVDKENGIMTRRMVGVACLCAALAGPAFAGGMAEPLMEPEVIVEESSASSGGIVVPLLLIAIIAAVASGSGGSGGPTF